jgi:zinc transport system substrate-binding protein
MSSALRKIYSFLDSMRKIGDTAYTNHHFKLFAYYTMQFFYHYLDQIKILLLLPLLFFSSCGDSPSLPTEQTKPLILVSLAPYQFLAQRIGGNAIQVKGIIPQNANPHTFEPTARQMKEVCQGDLWFRIGEPFENKLLSHLQRKNSDLKIVDLREKIDFLPLEGCCPHCSHDAMDRHFWLSLELTKIQATKIADILCAIVPSEATIFQKNLQNLYEEISLIDDEIRSLLNQLQHRSFVVSHPAFGYFCRDYQLKQLSIEEAGKEPRPKHVESVMRQAKLEEAKIALALPQHNNKGVYLVAKQLSIPVHSIDPYSFDYLETMRHLASLLANGEKIP